MTTNTLVAIRRPVGGKGPSRRLRANGKIPAVALESNTDHWGADHCVDSDVVPGVIFANRDLHDFGAISFRDVPFLAIGKHLDPSHIQPPSQAQARRLPLHTVLHPRRQATQTHKREASTPALRVTLRLPA